MVPGKMGASSSLSYWYTDRDRVVIDRVRVRGFASRRREITLPLLLMTFRGILEANSDRNPNSSAETPLEKGTTRHRRG